MRLTAAEWQTAQTVCTPKQLAVLDLWRRGAGYRRIAIILGLDTATVRDHVHRGKTRIATSLEKNGDVRPDMANSTPEVRT